jgi:phage host-nuclease inhibitor protein Gam
MSEEEFTTLRRVCVATGARSLSDLAREAMRGLMSGANQGSDGAASRIEYSAQMRDLEQKVEKLSAEIALVKADRNL